MGGRRGSTNALHLFYDPEGPLGVRRAQPHRTPHHRWSSCRSRWLPWSIINRSRAQSRSRRVGTLARQVMRPAAHSRQDAGDLQAAAAAAAVLTKRGSPHHQPQGLLLLLGACPGQRSRWLATAAAAQPLVGLRRPWTPWTGRSLGSRGHMSWRCVLLWLLMELVAFACSARRLRHSTGASYLWFLRRQAAWTVFPLVTLPEPASRWAIA